jgi:hypothetical protein
MSTDQTENDEQSRKQILENIKQYGCHLVLIESTDYLPAFVYTIGLYKEFKHPEIICFGLKTEVMAGILNHACDLIKKGEFLLTNFLYSGFIEGYKIQFLQVAKDYYKDYLGYGGWFYDMSFDFPALQLVWPDKENKFPWQPEFNTDWKFKQPLLDRNADFKFYEERNLGVFTTYHVLEGKPIIWAYHNEDGDWQFHSEESPNIEDAKIVCLEEITKIDPSINDIYHLECGYRASRKNKNDDWEIKKDLDEQP